MSGKKSNKLTKKGASAGGKESSRGMAQGGGGGSPEKDRAKAQKKTGVPRKRMTRKRRKRQLVLSMVLLGVSLLALGFVLLFQVREVEVVGNHHYTAAEVEDLVIDNLFAKNAAILWLGNRGRKLQGNTFVDTVDVELLSPWSVRIRVDEKKLAGYVRLGKANWYFDGKGIAKVDSEETELQCLARVKGLGDELTVTGDGLLLVGDQVLAPKDFDDGGNYIPLVRGVAILEPQLDKQLNGQQAASFRTIAAIKNYIDKCTFRPDSVEIRPEGRIWLHIGDVVVDLGSDGRVEIKLRELEGIYLKLIGKDGVLHLENYDGTSKRVIFSGSEEEEITESADGSENTENPENAGNPEEPQTAELPQEVPETPENPENAGNPEEPQAAELPQEVPETPENPENAGNPEEPQAEELPQEMSETPENPSI